MFFSLTLLRFSISSYVSYSNELFPHLLIPVNTLITGLSIKLRINDMYLSRFIIFFLHVIKQNQNKSLCYKNFFYLHFIEELNYKIANSFFILEKKRLRAYVWVKHRASI